MAPCRGSRRRRRLSPRPGRPRLASIASDCGETVARRYVWSLDVDGQERIVRGPVHVVPVEVDATPRPAARAALSLGVRGQGRRRSPRCSRCSTTRSGPCGRPPSRRSARSATRRPSPLLLDAVKQADQLRDEAAAAALRASAVEALGRHGRRGDRRADRGAARPAREAARDGDRRARRRRRRPRGGGARARRCATTGRASGRPARRRSRAPAGPRPCRRSRRRSRHKDPTHAQVRRRSRWAPSTPPRRSPHCAQAIADRDKPVREAAVEALAAIGSPAAIAALVAGLPAADRELKGAIAARPEGDDVDARRRRRARRPRGAARPVRRGGGGGPARRSNRSSPPWPTATRRRVAARPRALGRLADPRAAAALVGAVQGRRRVGSRRGRRRPSAAIGLAAADAVLDALRDRTATVRTAAAAALVTASAKAAWRRRSSPACRAGSPARARRPRPARRAVARGDSTPPARRPTPSNACSTTPPARCRPTSLRRCAELRRRHPDRTRRGARGTARRWTCGSGEGARLAA